MDYQSMKMSDIIKWCEDNNQKEWLKKTALTPNEKGNLPTYFEIKKDFIEKFMPEIKPEKKPKKPSFYDIIKAL